MKKLFLFFLTIIAVTTLQAQTGKSADHPASKSVYAENTVELPGKRQIAETLYISIFTVRKHIANIYEKLHVNSNAQIMSLAYKNKLG